MAKKPRENRIPIMMSEDELRMIDDWRYENRIATRSDAVRRLSRLGLVFDGSLGGLWETLFALEGEVIRAIELLEAMNRPMYNEPQERSRKALSRAGKLEKAANDFDATLRDVVAAAIAVRRTDTIDRILEQMKDLRALREAQMQEAREEELEDSRAQRADIIREVQEKRAAGEQPVPGYTHEEFVEDWIAPIYIAPDLDTMVRLAKAADEFLKSHNPNTGVWLEPNKRIPEYTTVRYGFALGKKWTQEDLDAAPSFLWPEMKAGDTKVTTLSTSYNVHTGKRGE